MVERREREQGAERRRREPLASPGRWPKMIVEFKLGEAQRPGDAPLLSAGAGWGLGDGVQTGGGIVGARA